ncbi:beta-N-acetylhexosaminidase [Paenibacillus assamensis]|uniref:beta-N-acetylhexosaminidase n=1 Tax=Paenibacillus assamensis TaxID=311244 RepID=UPI0003F6D75B|nr:beta-N-acetylhexosaminidase [Paenibacillus assamensis]
MNISELTLEQKIGQMVMCGFKGLEVDEDITTLIEKNHLGGIIYFRRNLDNKEQTCKLSRDLQLISKKQTDIPLFICIDQEGGMVARIDWDDVTLIPGNMAVGAARDAQLAYDAARICGEELLKMGINMNFAPSVDINNNAKNPVIGVRSYGERPDLVSQLGNAQIRGLQDANVSATAKHFPGHGDTAVDSHHGLASVAHDEERLTNLELVPFVQAISAGVDLIMTAHVMFPAFEPEERPATVSRRVLTDLLRNRLQYQGIIVTDCLEMKAISDVYGVAEGAVMSVEAGADVVLVSHRFAEQTAAIEALVAAARAGRISEAQINASVERILQLKQRRQMDILPEVTADFAEQFATDAAKAVVEQICEKSITLIKDEGLLPLQSELKTLVIWPEVREHTEVDEPIVQKYTVATGLEPYLGDVTEYRIGTQPDADAVAAAVKFAADYEQIVIVTYNAVSQLHAGQVEIVNQLANSHERVIVASSRNPYDLNQFDSVKTYLCCYENRPASMTALAEVLVGRKQAEGKLPVTINADYPYGYGLNDSKQPIA